MLESLGSLASSPWIYAVVALSVLLDVFLPVLPSGVLVVTAATATATAAGSSTVAHAADRMAGTSRLPHEIASLILLGLCATTASVLGDLAAFRIARSGRLTGALTRSRRLAKAHASLGRALAAGGGALVVIARFAPAGRSVMSFGAGASQRRTKEFLPWSALAGAAWTVYSVGLGYFGGQWLGTSWFGTALSVLALFGAGALAAYVVRRPHARGAAQAAPAPPAAQPGAVQVIGCEPAPAADPAAARAA
ncbi:DedA family protein [Streptomyces tremellae]|uniref:VTT domain-containing protein n=1 Tax=Streptomyces tremellae TaxID=1124239 RepID=A0ABP7EF16_9ACTN